MQKLLSLNYQILSFGEKSILYTISLLPESWRSAKNIFFMFDMRSDSEEGLKFFDTLHELAQKGWLNAANGNYTMPTNKIKILYSFKHPELHYLKKLVTRVNQYFSKPEYSKVNTEYEQAANNILQNIKKPSFLLSQLARNFSRYCNRCEQPDKALKYSKLALNWQKQLDDNGDEMCDCYSNLAMALQATGKYSEAVETGQKCENMYNDNPYSRIRKHAIERCYEVMSSAYEKLHAYQLAKSYAFKAMDIVENNSSCKPYKKYECYFNIATSLYKEKLYQRAGKYMVKAYAEYCDEKGKKPPLLSKFNIKHFVYLLRYKINKITNL